MEKQKKGNPPVELKGFDIQLKDLKLEQSGDLEGFDVKLEKFEDIELPYFFDKPSLLKAIHLLQKVQDFHKKTPEELLEYLKAKW